MNADEFTKLYGYMQERFDSVEQKLDEKASQTSLDKLTQTIDNFVKRLDDEDIERTARNQQFDRLVEWARKVSKKTGIPLENL